MTKDWISASWCDGVSKCSRMESAIPDLSRVFLMSSHASKSYLETDFQDGDWLVLVKRVKAWESSRTVRKSPNYSMSHSSGVLI
jgi:hypothetical protein